MFVTRGIQLTVFWNNVPLSTLISMSQNQELITSSHFFLVEIRALYWKSTVNLTHLSDSDKERGLRCRKADVMTGFILLNCNSSEWIDKSIAMKYYEQQTRQTRHRTYRTENAPEGGIYTDLKYLTIKLKRKTKSLRRGQHTGYENYLHWVM